MGKLISRLLDNEELKKGYLYEYDNEYLIEEEDE